MEIRKIFLMLFVLLIIFGINLYSEIEYSVSGKVTRKGKGVKGVRVTIYTANPVNFDLADLKKSLSKKITIETKTDNNGEFVFYVPKGKYTFSFWLSEKYLKARYSVIGPSKITVINKNIKNLNFKVLTYREVVEANLDILKKIPLTKPTVKYKYGRIPIFSERECRQNAMYYWKSEKNNKNLPDYLKNGKMGKITVYYDFKNNPAYYEYPFIYKGVEVACYGVHAIGFSPRVDFSRYIRVDKNTTEIEFENNIEKYKKQKLSSRYMIPQRVKEISEKENCDIKDIVIGKLICSGSYGVDCLKVLLKIPSKNKKYLIGLNMGYIYENLTFPFDILFEYKEMVRVYDYITDYKKYFKLD